MIKWSRYSDEWPEVKRTARTTAGKEGQGAYPSDAWKKQILLAEHSPIRKIRFNWIMEIKSWVSVHFVRHKFGIEHWVRSQRTDRTGVYRDKLPQDAMVEHQCEANAQALIYISRKRLCSNASRETRQAWIEVKEEIRKEDPILASVMVSECVYRGFCPEMNCCGYVDTETYKKELEEYRSKLPAS